MNKKNEVDTLFDSDIQFLSQRGKRLRSQRLYNRRRPEHHKFYSSTEWKSCAAKYINEHPWCEECLRQGRKKRADLVDHIIEIHDGGARTDPENLQSLCSACHNRKTWLERWKRWLKQSLDDIGDDWGFSELNDYVHSIDVGRISMLSKTQCSEFVQPISDNMKSVLMDLGVNVECEVKNRYGPEITETSKRLDENRGSREVDR